MLLTHPVVKCGQATYFPCSFSTSDNSVNIRFIDQCFGGRGKWKETGKIGNFSQYEIPKRVERGLPTWENPQKIVFSIYIIFLTDGADIFYGAILHHMPKLPYIVCGAKSTNMTNMLKLGHGGSHETLPPRDQQDGSSACWKVETVLLKAFCTGAPLLPPVVLVLTGSLVQVT